jgi:tetratricopeptide (TPR) repeat protein
MKQFIGYLIFFNILLLQPAAYPQSTQPSVQNPDYQAILKYHLSELKTDPQNLKSTIILMETYYQINDFRKAVVYANIAEDIYQNEYSTDTNSSKADTALLYYILHTRGKSRHKLGDYRKAKIDYFKASEIHPADSDLLVDIGNLYYNMEEYDSALFYFKKAEIEFSNGFKSKFNMANTYYVLKKYDSALYYYDESIRIKDDFPYSYFYKGTIYN